VEQQKKARLNHTIETFQDPHPRTNLLTRGVPLSAPLLNPCLNPPTLHKKLNSIKSLSPTK